MQVPVSFERGQATMREDAYRQSGIPHTQCDDTLPTVTLNMLIDFLEGYRILSCPVHAQREFSTIVPVSKRDPEPFDETSDDARVLYVCHSDNAEKVLKEHPTLFVLALTRSDSAPEWVGRYADRILHVQGQENFSYFIFLLQRYFIENMVWENNMDRIVLQKGSLRELLNIGSYLTDNFMTVNDSRFNLIAFSDRIAPPDSISEYLIEVGCLPEEFINDWKEKILKQELMCEEPTEAIPFVQLHHPLYINNSYFASIVMICNGTEPTKGLMDLFMKVTKRAIALCSVLWKKHVQTSHPFNFFFARLMSGEDMSRDYVRMQAALAGIPDPAEFKLIALETGQFNKAQQMERLIEATARLNRGDCCCFPFKDNFYVLYYSQPSDSNLSHRKSLQQLDELVYRPFGISCGLSQVFESLSDLDMAYKQTRIALRMKETIKSELFVAGEDQDKGVFLFEETLLSYLVSLHTHDERFHRFTFSHTIVEKLYEEDQQNNTNYLALFWFYLHHERNASMVAQHLHMHRNTVIYHIEKIQKRFDFDLSIQSALERMRLDFKAFFLQSSSETFEDVFSEAKIESLHG